MTARSQLAVAAVIGRAGAQVLRDRVSRQPPPTTLDVVPPSFRHLTREWLTAALCGACPGARVESFEVGPGSDGTTARRSITVRYDEVGESAGLPRYLFAKAGSRLISRVLTGITAIAANECLFYSNIRRTVDLRAPIGHYATWDPQTMRSLVLLEDVSRTRDASFVGTGYRIDRRGIESMIEEMAAYHGAYWEDSLLGTGLGSLKDARSWQREFNEKTGFRFLTMRGLKRAEEILPAEVLDHRDDLWPAAMRSLDLHQGKPGTLLHQDTHPANWFVMPDGTFGLGDWQTLGRGHWALDYSYAVTAILEIEQRREWEQDLLRFYLERIERAGGTSPGFDEAWLAYRQQVFHGFIFWLYTLALDQISPTQERGLVDEVLTRMGAAIADLRSFESLSEPA